MDGLPLFKLRYLLAFGLLLQTAPILADTIEGRVVGVGDGATLTVADNAKVQFKIRLAGIDAPELRQRYGKESRQRLTDLVLGKNVKIEWRKRDDFDRLLGKVLVHTQDCPTCPKTRDVGLAQLEAGLAWWDRDFRREQTLEDQGYYEYAEFDAKTRRIGLWQDSAPVPPWEWRKKNHIQARLFTTSFLLPG